MPADSTPGTEQWSGTSRLRLSALIRRIDLTSVQVQLTIGIVFVAAVFTALYPDRFATWRNVENMARQGGTLAVVAIGQTFALISGGFDISVAATMGLASTFGALAMIEYGVPAGIAAGLGAGLVVGLLNGALIARYRVTPFIATLGMLAIARGVANEVSDGRSVSGIPSSFEWFGGGDWGPIPATVGMAIVVFVFTSFVLYRTRPGLYLYATGGSEKASRLSGVNVVGSELSAYVMCSLLAAVAGLMLASRVSVGQASLGQGFELMSIATAVIGEVAIGGGVGRLSGVILGVVLVSVLSTGMNIAQLTEFMTPHRHQHTASHGFAQGPKVVRRPLTPRLRTRFARRSHTLRHLNPQRRHRDHSRADSTSTSKRSTASTSTPSTRTRHKCSRTDITSDIEASLDRRFATSPIPARPQPLSKDVTPTQPTYPRSLHKYECCPGDSDGDRVCRVSSLDQWYDG